MMINARVEEPPTIPWSILMTSMAERLVVNPRDRKVNILARIAHRYMNFGLNRSVKWPQKVDVTDATNVAEPMMAPIQRRVSLGE